MGESNPEEGVMRRAIRPFVVLAALLLPSTASAQLWVAVEQPADDCGS